jgi:hypothetical protein
MPKTGIWLALLAAIAARAATIQVQVVGTTPTQAVLSYTAPDNNACTISVSESSSLSPVVNDVNPALFTGANLDNRPGSVVSGTSRVAVIGKRSADLASDGKFYSRALQAFTAHFFTITCGASSGSGTFTTENPPLGNSAPDTPPFALAAWGNTAWPSIDWTDQTKEYIDPNTGLLLKRVTGPGQQSGGIAPNNPIYYASDLANAWTNPQSILVADGNYATYSGPGGQSNALYVPLNINDQPNWLASEATDDLLLRLTGYADNGTTVTVCLTVDHGQNCTSTPMAMALPAGSGRAAQVTGPKSFPSPLFGGWGQLKIPHEQLTSLTGTVTVNGSSVKWASAGNGVSGYIGATYFPLSLKAGDHILIAGSTPVCPNNDCTIASVGDALDLTLTGNLGSWNGFSTVLNANIPAGATSFAVADASGFIRDLAFGKYAIQFADGSPETVACSTLNGSTFSGCSATSKAHSSGASLTSNAFSLPNFGVLIWKTPGSGGNVYLDSAAYDLAQSSAFFVTDDGSANFCSVQTVSVSYAADGATPLNPPQTGRLCTFPDLFGNPTLYLWVMATGESRLLAEVMSPPGRNIGNMSTGTFDPNNPNVTYFAQNDSSIPSVYQCTYNAANGKYAAFNPGYSSGENPNFTCANITNGAGNDLISQIAKAVPGFNSSYFYRISSFGGMAGGNYISVTVQRGQNSLAYSCWFDVTQPPGSQIVACHDTWSTYPQRWGGAHGAFNQQTSTGWGEIFNTPLTSQSADGIGLYQLAILSIGNNGGQTSLTPGFLDPSTCEQLGVADARWLALGATGRNCIQVTVASEPQNVAPSAADKAQWPSSCNANYAQLQAIQPGDYVTDGGNLFGEQFLVAAKTGAGCSPITLVLARGANQNCASAPTSHASGWTPVMQPTQQCNGNVYWEQASNPTASYADPSNLDTGHTYIGQADNTGNNLIQWTAYSGLYGYNSYGARQGTLPSIIGQSYSYGMNETYPFAGSTAGISANYIQSHPGGQSYQATPPTLGYDGRPLGGAGGGIGTVWYHTVTGPVSGTTQVYQISPALDGPNGNPIESLDRKRLGMVAFAGRFALTDISGANSAIGDLNAYSYCIADFAGECRPGSNAGDRFVNVPEIDLGGVCIAGQLDRNAPCLATSPAHTGEATQYSSGSADPTAAQWRRLGMAFNGPGRTDNYWNVHGIVDGTWVFTTVKWAEGVRSDIVAIKLPPWPQTADGINRSDFVHFALPVQGQPGESVRVRFGYDTNLYCTTRREQCSTGGTQPFSWLKEPQSAAASAGPSSPASSSPASAGPSSPARPSVATTVWTPCAAACEVDIPALSGRVLYYVIDQRDTRGVITPGTIMVAPVP